MPCITIGSPQYSWRADFSFIPLSERRIPQNRILYCPHAAAFQHCLCAHSFPETQPHRLDIICAKLPAPQVTLESRFFLFHIRRVPPPLTRKRSQIRSPISIPTELAYCSRRLPALKRMRRPSPRIAHTSSSPYKIKASPHPPPSSHAKTRRRLNPCPRTC